MIITKQNFAWSPEIDQLMSEIETIEVLYGEIQDNS